MSLTLGAIRNILGSYVVDARYRDDLFAHRTCELALAAAEAGNYGVGSILVDTQNRIITSGQNRLFYPYFRSDHHAEMVVMNRFEDDRREAGALRNHRLYTSLEPCPMCTARLIIAGCPCVIYVADDPQGGMAKHLEGFPPIWRNLAEPCRFIKADCSPQLQELANRLFLYSAADLDARLAARSAWR
ncbi:MAG: nucleoside deaminase [Cyanobium sp.]|jgi:cytosine deaminase